MGRSKKRLDLTGQRFGRLTDLADGTSPEMLAAARVARKNNTSGVPGVDWVASKGMWRAAICFKGKRRYLGSYRRFEDAVKARRRAEEELFQPLLEEFSAGTAPTAAGG